MATTEQETAAEFGYSIAFFKSVPELYTLLKTATSQSYSPARFVAALQNTKWFRNSSESMRKYTALKASDPQTFASQLNAIAAHIWNAGGAMGAVLDPTLVNKLSNQAMQLGWNEDQLKRFLSGYVTAKNGRFVGQAGAYQTEYDKMASDLGISVGSSWMAKAVKDSVMGVADQNVIRGQMQQIAASKYVALKDRILAGETVRQIADPYLQSYAKILEVNGENIKLDDRLIQKALQSRDAKGQPTTQTVYDFEQTLRNDPRWAKTKNAQDSASTTANEILRTFGLGG